jgi:hypothetical protein
MSVDHPATAPCPTAFVAPPAFLGVKPGDLVIVQDLEPVAHKQTDAWWMGQVVFCEGGARDPKVNTMFQVANVDTGVICWINADEVTQILK